jgi:hypothetical protein
VDTLHAQTKAMHEAQIAGAPEELKPFYTARRQRLTEIGDLTTTLAKIPANETTAEARAALTKQIDFKKAQVDDTTQLLMAPDFGKAYPIYLQLERERNEASGSTAKRWASASENYIKRLKVENAINARNTAEARGNVFSPSLLPSPTGFPPMNRGRGTPFAQFPAQPLQMQVQPQFQPQIQPVVQPVSGTQTGRRPYGVTPAWLIGSQPSPQQQQQQQAQLQQQQTQQQQQEQTLRGRAYGPDRFATGGDMSQPVFFEVPNVGLRLVTGDGKRLVSMRNGMSNLSSAPRGGAGPCFFCNGPHNSCECVILRGWHQQGLIDANGHPLRRF